MTVTQILHFRAPSPSEADDQAQETLRALKGTKAPENYVFGTQTQDKQAIQLTSEWHDPKDEGSKEADTYRNTVLSSLGNPESMYHVSFKQSAFHENGPLSSPLVEFVQIWFPSKTVTASFRSSIEKDFEKFDKQCMKMAKGNGGLAYGWVLEEQEHEEVKGKAKCFFVARGWEGMQGFRDLLETEEYKGAVPVLLKWKAPYKMWHVKRSY
jgi:hypothetical protein